MMRNNLTNKTVKLFIFFLFIGVSTSCVTIIRGVKSKKTISITGYPENASVIINGRNIGTTPIFYEMQKRETQYVEISKDGFISQIAKIETNLNQGLTLASLYFGSIGLFIPTIIDLTKGSLRTIKTKNINYSLMPDYNKEESIKLQAKNDALNTKTTFTEVKELNIEFRSRPERKDNVFKLNCDSCLMALKMFKYSLDNGMSFSSDIFDPIKIYLQSCYEIYKNSKQSNVCEKLNPLFSNLSKTNNQDWNISKPSLLVFQFNTKETISNFSKAIKKQIAPQCNECDREFISFKKLVTKGYGEIEFRSNVLLQRCFAQRLNACSKGFYNRVNALQDKVNFPLKIAANRVQKQYEIIQEIGILQVFRENNYKGLLNNGVLILPPSFNSLELIKLNANYYVYGQNNEKQILYSQYGDNLIEGKIGSLLIDEEKSLVTLQNDGKWQLFLMAQLKLIEDKYDKIESTNSGNILLAWNNEKISLINRKGLKINDNVYDNLANNQVIPNNDLIIMEINNKQGLVNPKGIEITPFIYDKIGFNSNEYEIKDLIKGRIIVEIAGKIGYLDETGQELIPVIYDEIEGFGTLTKKFSDNLVKVKKNGKIGLIDFEDGQLVIPVMYNEIFDFQALTDNSYKIAKVNKNGKYGFINMDAEEIISPIYDEIKDFNNGYASFRVNNKWGLINSLGKETINSSYDEPLYFNGNETYATLNGSKVKIDRFGNQIKETPVYETKQPDYDDNEIQDFITKFCISNYDGEYQISLIDGDKKIVIYNLYNSYGTLIKTIQGTWSIRSEGVYSSVEMLTLRWTGLNYNMPPLKFICRYNGYGDLQGIIDGKNRTWNICN